MIKFFLTSTVLAMAGVGLLAENALAATYDFEDMIDEWVVNDVTL